ncbi:hypothetical protein M0R45_035864 [Rubus argutus]|uniref:Peptidase S8/S53 domain-containing protein n=1 Tax=Rubus argutus TaxID=59490 RepID=A0AAW1VX88_RUBAR
MGSVEIGIATMVALAFEDLGTQRDDRAHSGLSFLFCVVAEGVTPKSRLSIYKVSTNNLPPHPSDILAGIDQAIYIADGVNVISISLGVKGLPMHMDIVAKASFSAIKKGIIVLCAGGNDDPSLGMIDSAIPWLSLCDHACPIVVSPAVNTSTPLSSPKHHPCVYTTEEIEK